MGDYPQLINPSDKSTITINNSTFSIGRNQACDHVIPSLDVSRFHCIIKKSDNKWTLFDRSTNGTLVNSKLCKFNESIDLKHGDVIKLGPNDLSFIFTSQRHSREERPAFTKTDPSCSTSEFPNDDELIEEAADLLEAIEGDSNIIEVYCAPPNPTAEKLSESDVQVIEDTKGSTPAGNGSQPEKCSDTKNFDIMENELTCSICSELFIRAVTLNCSHTYCKYCIEEWRKNKSSCPICRKPITTVAPTLVLDNFIEKIIETQKEEMKQTRKEIIKQRSEFSEHAASSSSAAKTSSGRDETSNNYDDDDDVVVDDSDSTYTSDDDYDYEYHGRYGRRRPYYGGYGNCYICNDSGHWANSCPFKRR